VDDEHDDDLERRLAEPPPGWRRDGWALVGKAIAIVLVVAGLTVIGILVLFVSALNSWGSNK
jgi:hypothetical protein